MKTSRIIVLFLAIAAAGGAFYLANGSKAPPPPEPVAAAPPPPPPPILTEDVLVASRDIPLGTKVGEQDFAWQPYPKDLIPAYALRRSQEPNLRDELKGTIASAAIAKSDLVHREILKTGGNGFMSAILPAGKRAVAITIDSQGATSAGNFILPNDRVDVVRTFRQPPKPGGTPGSNDSFVSETLLSNIRVLAIGQNIQDKNGQPVVQGTNATLELDPSQAETVILAQRTGQLSLTLRSLQDAREATSEAVRQASHTLSVVRYGNVSEDGIR